MLGWAYILHKIGIHFQRWVEIWSGVFVSSIVWFLMFLSFFSECILAKGFCDCLFDEDDQKDRRIDRKVDTKLKQRPGPKKQTDVKKIL